MTTLYYTDREGGPWQRYVSRSTRQAIRSGVRRSGPHWAEGVDLPFLHAILLKGDRRGDWRWDEVTRRWARWAPKYQTFRLLETTGTAAWVVRPGRNLLKGWKAEPGRVERVTTGVPSR